MGQAPPPTPASVEPAALLSYAEQQFACKTLSDELTFDVIARIRKLEKQSLAAGLHTDNLVIAAGKIAEASILIRKV